MDHLVMISPLSAMFTGHLICPIEPPDFTALVRPAIFPPIGLPVLTPILSAIQLTGFSPIPTPIINHIADIVPPTTPTVIAVAARPAID